MLCLSKKVHLLGIILALSSCSKGDSDSKPIQVIRGEGDAGVFTDVKNGNPTIQKVAEAVVMFPGGTGFFLNHNGNEYLITNNHVFGKDDCFQDYCYVGLTFGFQVGNQSPIKVTAELSPVAAYVGADFAAYEVNNPNDLPQHHVLQTTSFKYKDLKEQSIYIVGHPAGSVKKYSTGTVLFKEDMYVATTTFTVGGNSGSPVVNTEGQFVGILHSGKNDVDFISLDGYKTTNYFSSSSLLTEKLDYALQNPEEAKSVFIDPNQYTQFDLQNEALTLAEYLDGFNNSVTLYNRNGRRGVDFKGEPTVVVERYLDTCETKFGSYISKFNKTKDFSEWYFKQEMASCLARLGIMVWNEVLMEGLFQNDQDERYIKLIESLLSHLSQNKSVDLSIDILENYTYFGDLRTRMLLREYNIPMNMKTIFMFYDNAFDGSEEEGWRIDTNFLTYEIVERFFEGQEFSADKHYYVRQIVLFWDYTSMDKMEIICTH